MAGRPVDEKIVAMKMDNSDFKAKAVETTGLFGKLKDALNNVPGVNLSKVTQSFSDIQSAASKVDLHGLANNIETIGGRFTNLGVMATTALVNISNKAVDAGLNLVKSLTLDPIMDGFREYETKMGSIQTILANTQSKGTTLDDVKKSLAELNTYADKTIYSFGDMTRNIGLFTNAGLGLQESTSMIKGFSNAAAASGTNAEQAANAAYQLSQGLSSGYIITQDWISLTNAGMGNDNMKRDLMALGRAMGTLDKAAGDDKAVISNWKDELTKRKWLTTDVMSTYLQAMAGDMDEATLMAKGLTKAQADLLLQNAKTGMESATMVRTWSQMIGTLGESVGSGWATSFELIFGDFDVATRLFTGLTNAIGGIIAIFDNARNSFIKGLADAGVFKGFFDIITNAFDAVSKILGAITTGISNAFSGTNLGIATGMGDALQRFAAFLTPSAETLNKITIIFQALFSVVNIVVKVLATLGGVLLNIVLIPIKLIIFVIGGLINGILTVAAYIGQLVIAFTDGVKTGKDLHSSLGGLKGIFSAIGSVIGKAVQYISAFASAIQDAWHVLATGDITNVGPWAKKADIVGKLLNIRDALKWFVSAVKEAWNILVNGSFDVNAGPFGANSKIVEKLFAIREAVRNTVNAIVEAWNILVKGDFTGKGPWEEDSRIVNALFTIREAVKSFVSGVVEAWNILVKGDFTGKGPWEEDSKIVDKLFKIREAMFEFASGVSEAWDIIVKGDYLGKGPWAENSKMVSNLKIIRSGVEEVGNAFEKAGQFLAGFWDYLTKKKGDVKPPWENMNMDGWLKTAKSGMQDLGKVFSDVGGAIGQAWSVLVDGVFTKQGPWDKDSTIVKWLYKIRDACKAVADYISGIDISLQPVANFFSDFFDSIGKGWDWIKEKVAAFANFIKEHMPNGQQLMAGGTFAAMAAIVAFVGKIAWDIYKVFTGWGQIGGAFKETLESVSGAFDSFSKTMKANNTAVVLVAVAIAIGILALSLKLLSTINVEKMGSALTALVLVLSTLVGAMTVINKWGGDMGPKTAIMVIGLAIAVGIMAISLKKLSEMSWEEIAKGITGLVVATGILAGAVILMSKFGGTDLKVSTVQLLALAASIILLVVAIKMIAGIDTGELTKGLIALGAILIELGIFSKLFGKSNFNFSAGVGLMAMATAILIIVGAIKLIAMMKVDELKQGLVTIGLILLAIAAFSQLTSDTGLLATGAGLLLLSVALNLLIIPIMAMAALPFDRLVQGLFGMTVVLLAVAAASKLMTGMIASGAGLILMAIALNLLLIPIMAMAALSWGALLKGIAGLALSLIVVAGVSLLLSEAIPFIAAFGIAIALLGLGMLAAGAGMFLFASGLVTLATMTSAAITAIVSTLTMLIMGLASLIPLAVNFIADLIVQIIEAILIRIPIITEAVAKMLVAFLLKIAEYIPKIVDAAVKIITAFLDSLAQNLPKIVDSAANLMVTFIQSLADTVEREGPKFTSAVLELMGAVLLIMIDAGVQMVNALFGWIPGVKDATSQIGSTAEQYIRDNFGAKKAGEDKGKDFADGVNGKKGDAETAGKNISKASKDGANSADIASIGTGKGTDFINGLNAQSGGARSAGSNIANSGKDGAGSVSLNGTGSNFGQGFAGGITSTLRSVVNAASGLAEAAKDAVKSWLHIKSPSRVMREMGGFFGEGFGLGITDMTSMVSDNAKDLAVTAKDSLNKFLDGFELPDSQSELHFKAVVDYEAIDPSKFGSVNPLTIRPDTSLTNGLVASTKDAFRQNGNNSTNNVDKSTTTTQNNYEIKVESKGINTRSDIKKLAEQIQTEIKDLNDRTKISRGEEVAF